MKTIIAGSRNFKDYDLICRTMDSLSWKPSTVLSGRARGADTLGEIWAKAHGIPVLPFPAKWDLHGRAAGPIRNEEMARVADALVAFPLGDSKGTLDMIRRAEERGLLVKVVKS